MIESTAAALNAALITAHGEQDPLALQQLHGQAADWFFAQGDSASAYFQLTHAYVFALVNGDGVQAALLAARLIAAGRL